MDVSCQATVALHETHLMLHPDATSVDVVTSLNWHEILYVTIELRHF